MTTYALFRTEYAKVELVARELTETEVKEKVAKDPEPTKLIVVKSEPCTEF